MDGEVTCPKVGRTYNLCGTPPFETPCTPRAFMHVSESRRSKEITWLCWIASYADSGYTGILTREREKISAGHLGASMNLGSPLP